MLRRRSDSSGVGGAGGDRGGVLDLRFTFAIPFETSSPVLATSPCVTLVVACLLVDKSMAQNAVFAAETDPIAELTVSTDSDAYYLYQYAQVSAALGLGGE